jgi:hypothetical protein
MRHRAGFQVRSLLGVGTLSAAMVLGTLPASPASAVGGAPVAVPDIHPTPVVAGQSVTISPLVNDSDPDNDPLTLATVTVATPNSGSAVSSGNDVVVTPSASFAGSMVIDYTVTDGTQTAGSTITVSVTPPPNKPPVAVDDNAKAVAGSTVRVKVLANDSDPDDPGGDLTIAGVLVKTSGAGTASIDGQEIVVKTSVTFAGSMLILYRVADPDGASATATLTVTVTKPVPPNRAPVARGDKATVRAGQSVTVRVLANDSDPDGDPISLVSVGKPTSGTATRYRSSITYKAPNSPGKAWISYTIKDSRGARARGVLTVTITSAAVSRGQVESALKRLRLPTGSANGVYDAHTRRALCTWRTVTGRAAHRGLPTAAEARAIVATTKLPRARSVMVNGLTVSVTCQAVFWVNKDRQYRRIMPASTGSPGYRTRLGTWRIFRTHHTWRYSTLYPDARMYKPMQFSGGQAIHGSASDSMVKTYPASHGCVRMLHRDIDAMQAAGVGNGTLVRVIGYW